MNVDWTRILAVGDLHLRKTCPAMRLDDFFATQERKLEDIFAIAEDNGCGAVVFPGDVFDRSDAPHGLVEWAIRHFRGHSLQYLFVFGQHDLRYHTSDKQNTPLGVLVAGLTGQAHILSPNAPSEWCTPEARLAFWGCSWGEALPVKLVDDAVNIIVMHRPVTVDPLPWQHEDLITAKQLVKTCGAQLFLTGDNHKQFTADFRRASVINLGSVMRTTTVQIDHRPAVAMISFAADDFSYELKRLTIRKGVFDEQSVEEHKANEERLAAFVDGLSDQFDPELRFIDNLRMAAESAPGGVRQIIEEVMR